VASLKETLSLAVPSQFSQKSITSVAPMTKAEDVEEGIFSEITTGIILKTERGVVETSITSYFRIRESCQRSGKLFFSL
jgi:hypothetical protein